jgi:hypothetical protein
MGFGDNLKSGCIRADREVLPIQDSDMKVKVSRPDDSLY